MLELFCRAYWAVILKSPLLALAALALLVVAMGFHATRFSLDASADALLLENDQELRQWRQTQSRYAVQDMLVVGVRTKSDAFSDEGLSVLHRLAEELGAVGSVQSVFGLLDVPLFESKAEANTGDSASFDTLRSEGIDRTLARNEILASPLFGGLILSEDGAVTALVLTLKQDTDLISLRQRRDALRQQRAEEGISSEQSDALEAATAQYRRALTAHDTRLHHDIAKLRRILAQFSSQATTHLGGTPMIADDMVSFIRSDLIVFGFGVTAFIILTLAGLFRRIQWVALPLASCAVACVVMLGILGLAGWQVTVISSNFISLMLIMTMSMNIHLVVRCRQIKQDNPTFDTPTLVAATIKALARPCLYTAVTTIIGFCSLVFSGIKPVIDFGYMMSLGIVVAYVTSFILFPCLLLLCGAPTVPSGTGRLGPSLTGALATSTLGHGRAVLVIAGLLTVVGGVGIYQLEVENSFIKYFRASTEIYQGMALIDRHLGGTTPIDVLVRFDEEPDASCAGEDCEDLEELLDGEPTNPADAWFTKTKTDQIARAHDYLDSLPEIGKVLSLTSLLRAARPLNEGRELTSFDISVLYRRLPSSLRRDTVDAYVSIDHNEARIAARLLDSRPDIRRKALLEKIEAQLPKVVGVEPENIKVGGTLVLYSNMLQSLFQSQIMTAGAVVLGIGAMFFLLFRSLTVAFIGTLPNALAAGLVLGIMGLCSIPLDMMTITIAAITIGIAVDDGIHYLYRFRERWRETGDYAGTLIDCHQSVGKAMLYTSVTVVFGFSILVFSNFVPTMYFGVLTGLAMTIAVVGSLTLLPKLILAFRPFGPATDATVST
ncbi:MAG: MMPL family transporter [Gammaproteobacteria bacterium]|nr:MMPL family transporter [Gammaproteobacteria bacterium]